MEHYRCQCGEIEAWTTMAVAACDRCLECGGGLSPVAGLYVEPKPHAYTTRHGADGPYEVCEGCLRMRAEIEAERCSSQP